MPLAGVPTHPFVNRGHEFGLRSAGSGIHPGLPTGCCSSISKHSPHMRLSDWGRPGIYCCYPGCRHAAAPFFDLAGPAGSSAPFTARSPKPTRRLIMSNAGPCERSEMPWIWESDGGRSCRIARRSPRCSDRTLNALFSGRAPLTDAAFTPAGRLAVAGGAGRAPSRRSRAVTRTVCGGEQPVRADERRRTPLADATYCQPDAPTTSTPWIRAASCMPSSRVISG